MGGLFVHISSSTFNRRPIPAHTPIQLEISCVYFNLFGIFNSDVGQCMAQNTRSHVLSACIPLVHSCSTSRNWIHYAHVVRSSPLDQPAPPDLSKRPGFFIP